MVDLGRNGSIVQAFGPSFQALLLEPHCLPIDIPPRRLKPTAYPKYGRKIGALLVTESTSIHYLRLALKRG